MAGKYTDGNHPYTLSWEQQSIMLVPDKFLMEMKSVKPTTQTTVLLRGHMASGATPEGYR